MANSNVSYRVGIPHAKDVKLQWALWCGKEPRSLKEKVLGNIYFLYEMSTNSEINEDLHDGVGISSATPVDIYPSSTVVILGQ